MSRSSGGMSRPACKRRTQVDPSHRHPQTLIPRRLDRESAGKGPELRQLSGKTASTGGGTQWASSPYHDVQASVDTWGERTMSVCWGRDCRGWPSVVLPTVRRKVGALSRHGRFHQKIGITNWPERRWAQAYRDYGWSDMHVLYGSSSLAHVQSLERLLINAFRGQLVRSDGYFHNAVGGGGGRHAICGPYYLYAVGARKYARIIYDK